MNGERSRPLPSESVAHLGAGTDTGPLSGADDRLEMAIEATRQALLAAKTREIRVELAEQMRQLIGERSPWQIARMEHEKGLR